jgi:predicted RNA-binding protein with PUA-like domain
MAATTPNLTRLRIERARRCVNTLRRRANLRRARFVAKRSVHYWLMKSEPDVYSIDDLARAKTGTWEGVRNYQARNHMRAMAVGDLALFYHSSVSPPGVVGLMTIAREAYVDDTQFDPKSPYHDASSKPEAPRWERVDVAFAEKFPEFVTLDQLKSDPALEGMLVIKRGMRLSVQPVERAHFAHILRLAGSKTRVR